MVSEVININSGSELTEQFDSSKGLIIDLRNRKSFEYYHLANALNMDLMSEHFMEFFTDISKFKEILVYCDDGSRSKIAIKVLREMGYNKLFSIQNGINTWDERS